MALTASIRPSIRRLTALTHVQAHNYVAPEMTVRKWVPLCRYDTIRSEGRINNAAAFDPKLWKGVGNMI